LSNPVVSETKSGSEGMITPNPIESIAIVIRIKISAFFECCMIQNYKILGLQVFKLRLKVLEGLKVELL
jgi:hypothetical protein